MASFGPQVKNMAQRSCGEGGKESLCSRRRGAAEFPAKSPFSTVPRLLCGPPNPGPIQSSGSRYFPHAIPTPARVPPSQRASSVLSAKAGGPGPVPEPPSWPSCAPTVSPLQPPTFPDAGGLGKGGTRGATEPGWAPGAPHRLPGSRACSHSAQTAPCCGDPSPPGAPESPPSPPPVGQPPSRQARLGSAALSSPLGRPPRMGWGLASLHPPPPLPPPPTTLGAPPRSRM